MANCTTAAFNQHMAGILEPMTNERQNRRVFSAKLEPRSTAEFIADKIGPFYQPCDTKSADFVVGFYRTIKSVDFTVCLSSA